MPSLTLVKLTKKHHQIFGELLLYFNGCRLQALKKRKTQVDYLQPIPLQKIYERWKADSACKRIIKLAANVFFEQRLRGNPKTGKCSLWAVRDNVHLNAQTTKAVQALWDENVEHMQQVRTYLSTKGNEVEVKTVIQFRTADHATLFTELMGVALERALPPAHREAREFTRGVRALV